MAIQRSADTSCSISAGGKIAASASSPTGLPSGPRGGGGGLGRSATTLYQWVGMSFSSRLMRVWLMCPVSSIIVPCRSDGYGGPILFPVYIPINGYSTLYAINCGDVNLF
jgi:hypothetical protein